MESKTNGILIPIIAILIILGGYSVLSSNNNDDNNGGNDNKPQINLDGFAQCLKDKGAVFYGASWCSHCQNQKEMFGEAGKFLSYVECSTTPERGGDQTQECKDKKIEGYPTWEFADGTRQTGEIPLEKLAEKTGCKLPK